MREMTERDKKLRLLYGAAFLVTLLGLSGSRFARIVLGSVFDVKDLACYAAGCLLLCVWERAVRRKICE